MLLLGQSWDVRQWPLRTTLTWVSVYQRYFGGSICTVGIDHSTAFSFPGKPKPGSIWITKVDILMTRSCNKIFLIILLIREININTIRRYHYTPSSMLLLLLLLSHFSCVRLCDPIDGSPPGSAVPGTLQARTLEWVAISFSITSWDACIFLN